MVEPSRDHSDSVIEALGIVASPNATNGGGRRQPEWRADTVWDRVHDGRRVLRRGSAAVAKVAKLPVYCCPALRRVCRRLYPEHLPAGAWIRRAPIQSPVVASARMRR